MHNIHIYTDGSSKGNPGPGGYAIIIELVGTNYKKEFYEGFRYTTNNRMELLAVIIGLEKIKKFHQQIIVFTDSKYVIKIVEKQWIFKWKLKKILKIKNLDLWERFLIVYNYHRITFQWIKGHNSHLQNERCDQLAKKASQQKYLKIDLEYEKQNFFKLKF